jgi:hypothetical protein
MLYTVYYRRLEAVEGEEIGYLLLILEYRVSTADLSIITQFHLL